MPPTERACKEKTHKNIQICYWNFLGKALRTQRENDFRKQQDRYNLENLYEFYENPLRTLSEKLSELLRKL